MNLSFIDERGKRFEKLQQRTIITGILGTLILLIFVALLLISANLFITAALGLFGVILLSISILTGDTIDQKLL